MDYLWNLPLEKKNVSSCGGGCQTTAKTITIVGPSILVYKTPVKTFLYHILVIIFHHYHLL